MAFIKHFLIAITYFILLIQASIALAFETVTFYSASNNKNVEFSVIDEEFSKIVYNQIITDEKNAFNYPIDGCYARAHQMSFVMDKLKIVSGKIFIEGKFYVDTKVREVGWSYHVASLIAIKKNSLIDLYVIDPILFNQPVLIDTWKKYLIHKPKSKLTDLYFSKRFNYQPDAKHDDLNDYLEDEILNAQNTNRMNYQDGETLRYFKNKGLIE
jgi:hypothetical protein